MSSADGSDGADSPIDHEAGDHQGARLDTLLLEALIHVLVEKGVLTKNDALSVVQTATQVKRGALHEGRVASERIRADLGTLQLLYRSFEALSDRPGVTQPDGQNIYRLRPPVHGDRPEFPRED